MIKRIFVSVCLLLALCGIAAADITESFDNIATLPGAGWALVNNSAPIGTTGWFQGNPGIFSALSGASDSYIAANFLNAGAGGNISNWLITPVIPLSSSQMLTFFTRTESPAVFADRLELRLSVNGPSTDVGATDTSVGDFGILLVTINPALSPSGYPDVWTPISALVSGLGPGVSGRFAFRYSVPDTNTNGDYIGFDDLSVTAVPEPGTVMSLGMMLAGLALVRKAKSRR